MNKKLRPIPYLVGSERRRQAIKLWMWDGRGYRAALKHVAAANRWARERPARGE